MPMPWRGPSYLRRVSMQACRRSSLRSERSARSRARPCSRRGSPTNHAREDELYLRIYKKASGKPTVTYAEALDVALCWGWIDGLKKAFDDASFLQRFTPRRAQSRWSTINKAHVARLIAAARMDAARPGSDRRGTGRRALGCRVRRRA